jgi:hypothetical protein
LRIRASIVCVAGVGIIDLAAHSPFTSHGKVSVAHILSFSVFSAAILGKNWSFEGGSKMTALIPFLLTRNLIYNAVLPLPLPFAFVH